LQPVIPTDVAAGQYVASAGQLEIDDYPDTNNGVFLRNQSFSIQDITDGTDTTLLVGERSRNLADSNWVGTFPGTFVVTASGWPVNDLEPASSMVLGQTGPSPLDAELAAHANVIFPPNAKFAGVDNYWSLHAGGCNFVFCDGSVRFIKQTINPAVFASLATRAQGETVSADQL
jgi:prepilin-type processing-associated H-X9-DG protein